MFVNALAIAVLCGAMPAPSSGPSIDAPGDDPVVDLKIERVNIIERGMVWADTESAGDVTVMASMHGAEDSGYALIATERDTGVLRWKVTRTAPVELTEFALDPSGTRIYSALRNTAGGGITREVRNAADGTILWQEPAGSNTVFRDAIWSGDGSTIVRWRVAYDLGPVLLTQLEAFSAQDGSLLWTRDVIGLNVDSVGGLVSASGFVSPIASPDGSTLFVAFWPIVLPNDYGSLHLTAIEMSDGSSRWTRDLASVGSPAQLTPMVVANDSSGVILATGPIIDSDPSPRLFTFSAATGSVTQEIVLPHYAFELALAPDGTKLAFSGAKLTFQPGPLQSFQIDDAYLGAFDLSQGVITWDNVFSPAAGDTIAGEIAIDPSSSDLFERAYNSLGAPVLRMWNLADGSGPERAEGTLRWGLWVNGWLGSVDRLHLDVQNSGPAGSSVATVHGMQSFDGAFRYNDAWKPNARVALECIARDTTYLGLTAWPQLKSLPFDSIQAVHPVPGSSEILTASEVYSDEFIYGPQDTVDPIDRVNVRRLSGQDGSVLTNQKVFLDTPSNEIECHFSPNGAFLGVVNSKSLSQVFDLAAGGPVYTYASLGPGVAPKVAWIANGERFITLERQGQQVGLEVYDVTQGTTESWPVPSDVLDLEVTPDPHADAVYLAYALDRTLPTTLVEKRVATTGQEIWSNQFVHDASFKGIDLTVGDAVMTVGVQDTPSGRRAHAVRWNAATGDIVWQEIVGRSPIALILDVHSEPGTGVLHVYGDEVLLPGFSGPAVTNMGAVLTCRISDGGFVSRAELPLLNTKRRGEVSGGAIVPLEGRQRFGVLRQARIHGLEPATPFDGDPYFAIIDVETGLVLARQDDVPQQSFRPRTDGFGRVLVPGRALDPVGVTPGEYDGAVVRSLLPTLFSGPDDVPLASGGQVLFQVDQPSDRAGYIYLVAASLTGTAPGVPVGAATPLPIVRDVLTDLALVSVNTPNWPGFLGALDAHGDGRAALIVSPGTWPGFAGLELYFAGLVLDPLGVDPPLVTQPVVHRLVP